MTTAKLLTGLLIGALLSTGARAESRIEIEVVNGKQQASFTLGDSKCVLVGDQVKCRPALIASN